MCYVWGGKVAHVANQYPGIFKAVEEQRCRERERETDDKSERKEKRDKDRDKKRARVRVVESRQVGVCWQGPSGAIDPGWPYIRDRKPELHASSPSPRSPPSLLSSLLNLSPQPSSLLSSPTQLTSEYAAPFLQPLLSSPLVSSRLI